MTETTPVSCPTCFEQFEVACPTPAEVPCEVDYDCEVCCRPMLIRFWSEEDGLEEYVVAEASGVSD